ncbi:MAG: aldehyde dehydrogenase family protein, partial [Gammaproteobacteria bacterium]|nr:aldehyde dehydrogenase family protein [Gammaproteobacteria bacterium]
VLHVARFAASDIDKVVSTINEQGYGLTFGIHTRVDSRVEQIVRRIKAGNVYVNRNQIGAVVGTQPFGGEGLSGTGPKAGGPWYLQRFVAETSLPNSSTDEASVDAASLQKLVSKISSFNVPDSNPDLGQLRRLARDEGLPQEVKSIIEIYTMPGPTGETNQLSMHPRGVVLCLGPTRGDALLQAVAALAQQNAIVIVAEQATQLAQRLQQFGMAVGIDGSVEAATLRMLDGIDAVMSRARAEQLRAYRIALADRNGKLIPLICGVDELDRLIVERHLCIDTTAAGGNASLIAAGS